MSDKGEWRNGACHCASVRFRARLPGGLETARRCDCSLCRMRGAVAVTAAEVEILAGGDFLTSYRFNTMVAEHFFCGRCGIYTHHRRRSDPGQFGVNAATLDGVSPFDFTEVPVNNGRNHPSDGGGGPDVVGTLRFVPTA